ncbi:hypothetical protein M9H77_03166 [Catharanthus roseus]|uniref:Uncharacterized protein n=1 Tax=Catharanthus roseus TaxID=4058 RepID=A0ACC0CAC6_CATRO|nr:hypothetical protein M9H77_03166 [Catharanthus roseus]
MSVPKIETDRFDSKSDFVMWRRKMKAVLVQNKIAPNKVDKTYGFDSDGNSIFSEVLCVSLSPSCTDVVDHWVLDSGCSFHMSPNKHWFSDFKTLNQGKLFMGNNQVCDIKGIGSNFIKMHDGVTKKLTEVRYVPDLRRNLISLSYLDSLGLTFKSKNGILSVCKGNLVMLKGFKKETLYILLGKTVCNSTALISKTVPEKTIENGLYHLQKQHLLCGDKIDSLDFCDHCVLGKQHKISFSTSTHKSSAPLDYVHCDLWGMNRTIMDKVRCLLVSSGIPKSFWGEAVSTTVYLINRS